MQKRKFIHLIGFILFIHCLDVLSNLTQLETLDLSYNELQSLEGEDFNFTFPENLTRLYISNNKIWRFPVDTFDNITAVKVIDIQNNSIQELELNLLKSVKTGLDLLISGNFSRFQNSLNKKAKKSNLKQKPTNFEIFQEIQYVVIVI